MNKQNITTVSPVVTYISKLRLKRYLSVLSYTKRKDFFWYVLFLIFRALKSSPWHYGNSDKTKTPWRRWRPLFDPDLENKPLRGWVKRVVVQQAAFAHNAAHCSKGWSKVQKGMFLWIREKNRIWGWSGIEKDFWALIALASRSKADSRWRLRRKTVLCSYNGVQSKPPFWLFMK